MKIILPEELLNQVAPRIYEIAPDAVLVGITPDGRAAGEAGDADVLLRAMPQRVFEQLLRTTPGLRWVHTLSAGVDSFLTPELRARNLLLTNSAGAHAIAISEFVLAALLAHVKQIRQIAALTPARDWRGGRSLQLGELHGTTMLIIGLGSIGREVARRAAAFGVRVLGSRRRPDPVEHVTQVVGEDGWRALLPQADWVVICAPLTEATRGMVDQAAFAVMKPGAYLINIARGVILDTDALLAALRSGKLAGAALDALPEEPLPADHPLWAEPTVAISPHISGSSPNTGARELDYFYENLRRYAAGEELTNLVDMQAGY